MPTNVNKIQLSDLRCRIQIVRKQLTADGVGGNTATYSPVYSLWAAIDDIRGREHYRAERMEGLVYHQVVIRAANVTINPATDAVLYNSSYMPIKYLNSIIDGKLKYIEMYVVEGDPTGVPGAQGAQGT